MEFMKLREVKTDVEKMSGTRAMPLQDVRIGSVVADLREPSWTCPSRVDVAKKSSAQVEESRVGQRGEYILEVISEAID